MRENTRLTRVRNLIRIRIKGELRISESQIALKFYSLLSAMNLKSGNAGSIKFTRFSPNEKHRDSREWYTRKIPFNPFGSPNFPRPLKRRDRSCRTETKRQERQARFRQRRRGRIKLASRGLCNSAESLLEHRGSSDRPARGVCSPCQPPRAPLARTTDKFKSR